MDMWLGASKIGAAHMRVLADFRRRAFCERTAFVHHHDARRQGEDRIHIVLHQHNCAALGETPN